MNGSPDNDLRKSILYLDEFKQEFLYNRQAVGLLTMVIRMLMQKSDKIALRDTLILLGTLCLSGGIAIAPWPTWWSVQLGSILPLMRVGLPRIHGAWHHVMTGLLQHLGLAENVSDHRPNTRTVLMNPVSTFIYLNMNYHLEHHMFTMVPYYNLPRLHDMIKHDGRAQQLL